MDGFCSSWALVRAHQQLHPHGNAGVPAQRQQADVASYDGRSKQVLHRRGAIRVPIKDLRNGDACEGAILLLICFSMSTIHYF